MPKYKKSAKDLAFDRERARYRNEIQKREDALKEANALLKERKSEIAALNEEIAKRDVIICSLTEDSEVTPEILLANLKRDAKLKETLGSLTQITRMIYR